MRTIHIGISHDNNLMIPQLGNIKILMNSCSKRRDHSLDLRIGVNLIQPCFFYIQDFSSQWKDRLCRTLSRCLCRTTRRISLDDVDLTVFRIFV